MVIRKEEYDKTAKSDGYFERQFFVIEVISPLNANLVPCRRLVCILKRAPTPLLRLIIRNNLSLCIAQITTYPRC